MKFLELSILIPIAIAAVLSSCNIQSKVQPAVVENALPASPEYKAELEKKIAEHDTLGQRQMTPQLKEEAEALKKAAEKSTVN